jgi:hypothetical protein
MGPIRSRHPGLQGNSGADVRDPQAVFHRQHLDAKAASTGANCFELAFNVAECRS